MEGTKDLLLMTHLAPEQKQRAHVFKKLLLTNNNTTISCLRRFNWNLEWAVNSYLENPQMYAVPVEHNPVGIAFLKYLDIEDPKKMTSEGIADFLRDLRLQPSSIMLLVFAWKCRARTQGEFTSDEFRRGMDAIGVETVEKLREKMPELAQGLNDKDTFKDFYEYIFDYGKPINNKEIDIHTAIYFWRVLLRGRFKILHLWIEFLRESQYTTIQRDAWNLLYLFAENAEENLRNHDPDDAWPSIIDEFVEWYHVNYIKTDKRIPCDSDFYG